MKKQNKKTAVKKAAKNETKANAAKVEQVAKPAAPTAKPEPKPEAKPAAKPEPKPEAKPAAKPKRNASNAKILTAVYDALCGVVAEHGAEFFDGFYRGGGAKMMNDIQAAIERRREYARAYYKANREKLSEASRLCHARKRAAMKAAKEEVAK